MATAAERHRAPLGTRRDDGAGMVDQGNLRGVVGGNPKGAVLANGDGDSHEVRLVSEGETSGAGPSLALRPSRGKQWTPARGVKRDEASVGSGNTVPFAHRSASKRRSDASGPLAIGIVIDRRSHQLLSLIFAAFASGCGAASMPDTAVGTLEMVESDLGPMQPARVVRVAVREGDTVTVGDTLAVFAIPTLDASQAQAEARLAAARESQSELSNGARKQELARAEAELQALEADVARTSADLQRIEPLATKGDVSKAALDAATASARASAARRDAARSSLGLLREGARSERRLAAAADVRGAAAAGAAIRATARDLVLIAPADGVVLSRNAEPGEVLSAGQSAVTIGQPARPWARIFVSQFVVPSLHVGDTLTAVLDRDSTVYRGRVVAIATKAEFTPRVALTDQERSDLLFGVKIEFADPANRLKAGLPVTVRLPPTAKAPAAPSSVGK